MFGILGALWSAFSGVGAIIDSLDKAYEVKEERPWWKQKALSVGLTIALAIPVLSASGLALCGSVAGEGFRRHLGIGATVVTAWEITQWPVVIGFMFLPSPSPYYFAPNINAPEWHWVTPGSAFGLILWLGASLAFKTYLHFFDSYSKTYGSLGAMIILLLWLYITGLSILLGGL